MSLRGAQSHEQLVGGRTQQPTSGKLLPIPVTVSGRSFVSTFWLFGTFLLIAGLVIAAGFPNWIRNDVEAGSAQARDLNTIISTVDMGLYYLCFTTTGQVCGDIFCNCTTYLEYNPPATIDLGATSFQTGLSKLESVGDIPFLFSSSIIYAFGVGMFIFSLVIGVIAYCKPRICKSKVSLFLVSFVFQVFGGVALVVALVLFPVFLGSTFVEQFCGAGADFYFRGQCSINWALFLAMIVTACSLYLPALAIFSMNISDGLNAHVCC